MFFKNNKNVINKQIIDQLELINQLKNKIEKSNIKFNMPITNHISTSKEATEVSAATSNLIEGINVEIAKTLKAKNDAKQLVDNYNQILTYIKDYGSEINLTTNEILSWHNQLLKNTSSYQSDGGKFKTSCNAVVNAKQKILLEGAAPWQTPELVSQLVDWYNQNNELPELIKITIFILDFLTIHPFNDGNGRK